MADKPKKPPAPIKEGVGSAWIRALLGMGKPKK